VAYNVPVFTITCFITATQQRVEYTTKHKMSCTHYECLGGVGRPLKRYDTAGLALISLVSERRIQLVYERCLGL